LSSTSIVVSLSITNTTQAANGVPDKLIANVRMLGYPIAGATVTFKANQSFATIRPTPTTTGGDGNAVSYASSFQTGNVLINATFANVTSSAVVSFAPPVYVNFIPSSNVCPSGTGTVLTVDGTAYQCAQLPSTFSWLINSKHSYSFQSIVAGPANVRYVFNSVTGCGATGQNGTIIATANCTIAVNYTTQYFLSMVSNPSGAGTLSPGSEWLNYSSAVQIGETPNKVGTNIYIFKNWTGTGTGNYTGTATTATVTMGSPIVEQANYYSTTSTTSTTSSTSTTTSTTTLTTTSTTTSTTSTTTSTTSTTTSTTSTTTSTTSTTVTTIPIQYIYCVGRYTSPSTQVYYAPVSSTGIGTWTATTSYPVTMYDAGCSINNGYIYCVGTDGASPSTQVYYAPVSSTGIGTWTATTSYPVGMRGAGCSIYNGYIYCVGSGASPYTQVYYAPVSSTGIGTWTATTSYPVGMYEAGCSINNGYIYCVGTGGASPYTQVYYAPVSSTGIGTWTATTSYPVAMYSAGCSIYNGYIYCVGTGGASPSTQVYYAPVSSTGIGTWTATTSYPVAMYYAGCSIYYGYIYCVGTGGTTSYNQVYYAPVSSTGIGTWTATTSYPVGMYDAYCEIPGSGGGFYGGGGPN
ncbi:MAG: hypothetical protein QW346_02745, partial [Candidatus Micrarchaeaceae archaeon]